MKALDFKLTEDSLSDEFLAHGVGYTVRYMQFLDIFYSLTGEPGKEFPHPVVRALIFKGIEIRQIDVDKAFFILSVCRVLFEVVEECLEVFRRLTELRHVQVQLSLYFDKLD